MLTPDQVKPYLCATDVRSRELADRYFSSSLVPLLSADQWWEILDTNDDFLVSHYSQRIIASAQTPASIGRMVDWDNGHLKRPKQDREAEGSLLRKLPILALMEHRELIRSTVSDRKTIADVDARLALSSHSSEQLWNELEAIAIDYDQKAYSQLPIRAGDIVILLSQDRDFTIPRAVAGVDGALASSEGFGQSWMPIFALDLLGKSRHTDSIDRLIRTIEHRENVWDDAAASEAAEALIRIGGNDVIDAMAALMQRHEPSWNGSLCDYVANLRTPAVETIIVAELLRCVDPGDATMVATTLVDLCTTDPVALDKMREMVNTGTWSTIMSDPIPDLIALAEITGWSPPELPHWRDIENLPARKSELQHEFRKHVLGGNTDIEQIMDRLRDKFDFDAPDDSTADFEDMDSFPTIQHAAPTTFVRESPKIGRNDPCPCGSGKKYKKCCAT